MIKKIVCLIVAISLSTIVFSQEVKSLQESFLEAESYFLVEDYADALPIYLQLYENNGDNSNLAYRIGLCYLNTEGQKNMAISYLEKAVRNVSAKHKDGTVAEKAAPYDALFELGTAYRVNFQFDKAKEVFARYRETLLPDDTGNIIFVDNEIKVCDNAKKLIAKPVDFVLENAGLIFNDDKDNFNPIISADSRSMAYMVSLKFYDAIMFSKLVNGKWSAPVNINPDLQSDGDLYVSCLSSDGKTLFLSSDDDINSDLYFSSFDGNKWTRVVKLNKNINTRYWESHGFISEDGNSFVFASDRPGGFGGLDIYISKKENGDWGKPVNLGPEINTEFNEDRPFLINNGKTIFFASQGHNNLGGYDIFSSGLQPNGIWSSPQNIGYPLNTPDDNIFFMPTGNGKSGYISISRETDGFGKRDIYKITFK